MREVEERGKLSGGKRGILEFQVDHLVVERDGSARCVYRATGAPGSHSHLIRYFWRAVEGRDEKEI